MRGARGLSVMVVLLLPIVPGAARAERVETGHRDHRATSTQPDAGTVSVSVEDARTHLPLPGAELWCDEDLRATTDANGLARIPPCASVVRVTAAGFLAARLDPPVLDNTRVALQVDVTRRTETVDVAADAPATPDPGVPTQFVVTAGDLEPLRGALLDDPLRAMHALPGVASTDELRAELSVRGSPYRQVGLVMDDIKSQLLLHTVRGVEQTGSVALLNGDMLASASLSSGAYPQRFGNSIGAELVVRTRDGRGDRFHGRVMASAIATTATFDGPLAGPRVTWIAAVRRSYASWIVRRIDPDLSGTFDFQDAHGKVRAQLGPRHHLSLTWLAGASTYDERGRRRSAFAIDIGRNRTQLVSGQWQATPRSSLLLAQRVSYVTARFRNTNPSGQLLDVGTERQVLARSSATWVASRMSVDVSGVAEGFRLNGEAVRFGGAVSGQRLPFAGRTRHAGAHAHLHVQPWTALQLGAGARVDAVGDIGTAVSPWVQAALSLAPRWTIQAAHGEHRQAPDLLQRAGPNAGADLAFERATHDDVGIAWRSGGWHLGGTVFRRQERDVLDTPRRDARLSASGRLVPGDPRAPWTNALTGTARGVELLARYSATRWQGWVSYTGGQTTQRSPQDDASFPSAFDQRHMVSATTSATLSPRWDASATVRVASNWPYDGYYERRDGSLYLSATRNAIRLPTYTRVDLRVRRTFSIGTRRVVVFGEAINLLNRRNLRQVTGSYNGATAEVFRISEQQLPIIPSIGLAFEF